MHDYYHITSLLYGTPNYITEKLKLQAIDILPQSEQIIKKL
jgi:hypothetical protein